jgi:hypothetical protein
VTWCVHYFPTPPSELDRELSFESSLRFRTLTSRYFVFSFDDARIALHFVTSIGNKLNGHKRLKKRREQHSCFFNAKLNELDQWSLNRSRESCARKLSERKEEVGVVCLEPV